MLACREKHICTIVDRRLQYRTSTGPHGIGRAGRRLGGKNSMRSSECLDFGAGHFGVAFA
jgi:hypothetical protein